jgi:two-component system sensor histidine kinase/response regulator
MQEFIEIFPWNENFNTGIPEIDVQHRSLVDLLNELVSNIAFNTNAMVLDEIFHRLKEYTVMHFSTEEAIWNQAFGDDEWATGHHMAHGNFVAKILELKAEESRQDSETVLDDIVTFLTHWLALHIIETDKRMAKAALALRAGMTIPQAKRASEEAMAGTTRAMIDTVMSMYDKLATRTVQMTREITKRAEIEANLNRALEELRVARETASEARVRNLLELAPFPLLVTRASDGAILYGNQRARTQFNVSLDEAFGQTVGNFYRNPADRDAFIAKLQKDGVVYDQEMHLLSWDGKPYWALLSAAVIQFDGQTAVMVAINDIDERKKASLALEAERNRLRTLIQTIPDPIWVKDLDERYLLCNRLYERLFGARESEIVGKTDHDLVGKDLADSYHNEDRKVLESGKTYTKEEWQTYTDTGERRLFEVIKAPVYGADGKMMGILGIAQDITDIRQSQKALNERMKEQFCLYDVSSLTDDLSAGIENILAAVATRVGEGWQYSEIAETSIAYGGKTYASPGFRETPWIQTAEALTSDGSPVQIRVVYLEERPAEDEGPFLAEERNLINAITHRLADFIDRKRIAGEIKDRERLLTTMFTQLSDSVVVLDGRTGSFLDFNTAAHQGLGYTREEFAKLSVPQIQADLDEEEISTRMRKLSEGEHLDFASRHLCKDGSLREVHMTLRPLQIGELPIITAIWRDVTEEKAHQREVAAYHDQLEELVAARTAELAARNEEQLAIFESATTGIVMIRDRIILRCNHKLNSIFGYEANELIGKSTRCWYPDEDTFIATGQEVAESFKVLGHYYSEQELVRKDGTTFWARMSAQPLVGPDAAAGFVGIVEDISAERSAAEALRAAKDAAEEASKAKSSFLATMSHEIRTPLNAVIGMSHLTLRTDLSIQQRDYLTKIEQSGRHLLNVINDVLDFSKIEAGKMTVEKSEFELEQILGDLAGFLNNRVEAKDIELLFDIAPEVPQVLVGDRLRISQVLLNFGSNALKFTRQGEVRIVVRLLESTPTDVKLKLSVQDTGIGLSTEQVSRLFTSFQQADMSTTRKYGGTGLGLAICKKLVEMMGGEIGVESELDKGSSFWFTLWLGRSTSKRPALMPRPDLRGCRVLVYDENPNARGILGTMLKAMTFNCTEVDSDDAVMTELRAAEKAGNPFEVALIGCTDPGVLGTGLAKLIQEAGLVNPPRVILTAGATCTGVLSPEVQPYIADILRKPITQSALYDSIVALFFKRSAEALIAGSGIEAAALEERLGSIGGARILLVEDNELNQEVATGMLAEAGLLVDTAEDGSIAVKMVTQEHYDLVLMDMQMPVMDGLAATREIRKNPLLRNLPIVAMTANAMLQDREACLAAGMKDFVAKPIEPALLWAALLRWIPARQPGLKPAREPLIGQSGSSATSTLPARIPGVDIAAGLRRVMGKQALYLSILRKFLAGHADAVAQLKKALGNGDSVTAGRLAHTLRGVAGNIGATGIQQAAELVERAIKEMIEPVALATLIDELDTKLGALVRELRTFLPPTTGDGQAETGLSVQMESGPSSQPEAILPKLHTLRKLLADDDATAAELFETDSADLRMALGSKFKSIQTAIAGYDFSAALALLEAAMGIHKGDR